LFTLFNTSNMVFSSLNTGIIIENFITQLNHKSPE